MFGPDIATLMANYSSHGLEVVDDRTFSADTDMVGALYLDGDEERPRLVLVNDASQILRVALLEHLHWLLTQETSLENWWPHMSWVSLPDDYGDPTNWLLLFRWSQRFNWNPPVRETEDFWRMWPALTCCGKTRSGQPCRRVVNSYEGVVYCWRHRDAARSER